MNKLKEYYIQDRILNIDQDFLNYEEEFISESDTNLIISLLQEKKLVKLNNENNSILLYLVGLTDEFDFQKARCDTIDGSPPDIDIDFDAIDREKAIEWVVQKWGRDNVANIITHGTFKPKSLLRGFYRVTEGNSQDLNEFLKKIPQPKFGKEATLNEILEINKEVQKEEKYEDFLSFADKTEDMVSTFGIHAAGLVISDFPIHDVVPMWKNSKAERITQFNKDEVEELGLIKFDFLSIDTLSIIKECVRLIKKEKQEDLDVFSIEDYNDKAYDLMSNGLLTGIFQMETSGTAKKLISTIKPKSIDELSDISALNRPGPMQAGLHSTYINNKNSGYPEEEMPEVLSKILEPTNYTLVYQEQVMEICCQIAGFTLKEADDIRRAMGKKKKSVLDNYKPVFIAGAKEKNIPEHDATKLWDDLVGFADYCLHGSSKLLSLEFGYLEIEKIVSEKLEVTVLSMDNNGTTREQKIVQFWNKGAKECYEYTLENRTKVKCTTDHKFLTTLGYKTIEEIFIKQLEMICPQD